MAKTGTTAASGVTGKAARQPTSKARPSAMPVAQSAAGGVNLGADFGAANLAAMAQANSALIEGFGAIGERVADTMAKLSRPKANDSLKADASK